MSKLSDKARREADALAKDAEHIAAKGVGAAIPLTERLGGWVKGLTCKASAKVVGVAVIVAFIAVVATCG